ncbi:RDD family protein [Thalassotalea piscium]
MSDEKIEVADTLYQYVGFWARLLASLIDSICIVAVTLPILFMIYGAEYFDSEEISHGMLDVLINYLFPIIATIVFWTYKSATPGKMALNIKIVDAQTGEKPSIGQSLLRYLGYYVSLIPLGLGFLWIAWDDKKQGWHDVMAGTLVIYSRKN